MGFKYILYRVYHVFLIKSKLIKLIFPTKYKALSLISLEEWRSNSKPFFFQSRTELGIFPLSEGMRQALDHDYEQIKTGHIQYFNKQWIKVGQPIRWHHNPDSNYEYPKHTHWAYIPDLSAAQGDIKYVWEKSRFSFLYTIIRYDQHFNKDSSAFVWDLISSWIDQNPINQGPNYKCSQEISLRLLNWTYALYFYKESSDLKEVIFNKTLNSMRQQLIHVYRNIHFSRITVRNNHAITETMCLYLIAMLFPSFPESKKYQKIGKKYFEEEIAYQIYKDGSYLQFSMNYHRVVVQLLTWAMELSKRNNDSLSPTTTKRAEATLAFLLNLQDDSTGLLPNYGANDGALFFKLNNEAFLNHSAQLNALHHTLKGSHIYRQTDLFEDTWWYSGGKIDLQKIQPFENSNIFEATTGGFYVLRQKAYFAMLRCGNHKDRPQQADQNHLDIWYMGKNILRDNGSYKYNTDAETVNYFSGTASHNTVQIGSYNQMLKGGRFIWYYWSQALKVETLSHADHDAIDAVASVYTYLDQEITHRRQVRQYHLLPRWEVEDTLDLGNFSTNESFKQIWHLSDDFYELGFEIKSWNKSGETIEARLTSGWHSPVYGDKQASQVLTFEHHEPYFRTVIQKKVNG